MTAACSKNETIQVVCEGSEVTSSLGSSETESRSSKKTIRVLLQSRAVQTGIKYLSPQLEEKSNWSESSRSVWTYQVDSDPEIFDRSTTLQYGGKTESLDRKVEVDSTAISVFDHHRQVFRVNSPDEKVFIKYYHARIDRISGGFYEEKIDYYYSGKNEDRIKVETQGSCRKADQKF
jgi:hypothetical protein